MTYARLLIRSAALCLILTGMFHITSFTWDDLRSVSEYEEAADLFTQPAGDAAEERKRVSGFIGKSHNQPVENAVRPKNSASRDNAAEPERAACEDIMAPLTVDWDKLRSANEDIVGWIYMEGDPSISYPILQGETNDTYLHTTYRKSYLYAGSIFLNATSSSDFSDSSSFVFGHNMRSGTMFGRLKYLMNQASWEAHPYFWILTPEGNYRYRIFAAVTTTDGSEVYSLWKEGGENFTAWAGKLSEMSVIDTGTKILEDDLVVGLSTCMGSGTQYRNVIFGVLVSSARPDNGGSVK